MTDRLEPIAAATMTTNRARQDLTRARNRAETRFRFLGLGAVLVSVLFLVLLLSTIVGQGLPAFTYNYVKLPVDLTGISREELADTDFGSLLRESQSEAFPRFSSRNDRRLVRSVMANGSDFLLQGKILENPSLAGHKSEVSLPLSDFADLYMKGLVAKSRTLGSELELTLTRNENGLQVSGAEGVFEPFLDLIRSRVSIRADEIVRRIEAQRRGLQATSGSDEEAQARRDAFNAEIERQQAQLDKLKATVDENGLSGLDSSLPSLLLISIQDETVIFRATSITGNGVTIEALLPIDEAQLPEKINARGLIVETPETDRKFSDREIAFMEHLRERGLVTSGINRIFFSYGASREAETAGIWGAVVGSFLTLVVTLMLSFPIGVAAAIYLEEFSHKNRFTDFIEVNINNLAAVPSIVFGLLGLAMFLNWFNMPRSAPLVGGMVLALMTLPTIIIASRAALKAVPPSIREAALGVGASRLQMVFHHVLPLAMPGILTGSIIGMAQALGETAPLLMIGMVAFIVDIPGGFTDPATVLPVQIFMWADFPEPAFQQKTAAAIMVLLAFLVLMNALAIFLRSRFERRW